MKNEKGSILVSVCLFVSFVAFIMGSTTLLIRNQVIQMRQFQYNYLAQSMVEIAEDLFFEYESVEEGIIYFSDGVVSVKQIEEENYRFSVKLDNEYRLEKVIERDVK